MNGLKEPVYDAVEFIQARALEYDRIYRAPEATAAHTTLIRKVSVSPSKVYIEPPSIETSNRVIRHFSKEKDNFLRVNFTEEGLLKIGVNTVTLGQVYNRLYNVLLHGLTIGNKHYEFLAFSSSQLREHGCWFFASTENVTAHSIRHWMGDFRSIKNIAKYASRMGQCFSSTRAIATQPVKDIQMIPDIIRNGYTFSDGVGKISPSLAKNISRILDLEPVPSAFQFRLGGSKGVLALSPYMRGDQVHIRPSQVKFESDHNILEIVKVATYIPCYLNRQIITLLSTLGVPDTVFLDLQQQMIKQLSTMSTSDAMAIKVLTQNADEYGITRRMVELIRAGHRMRQDPYLVNLLKLFQISLLKDVKQRARIHVPKGCLLMGVLDDTLSLRENQIFLQYTDPENPTERRVVEGPCIVTRNPCFHPGDVRVVEAVNVKALAHLYNCVAFSALGFRDVPNQCSGGDLDGDFYTVIWDQELIPPTRNYPPMEYDPPVPVKVDEVNMDHVKKFFVNYIASDNLGLIANAHLVHSDRHPDGAFNGICLRLAQLNSLAVDFPKTGVPAEFEPGLRAKEYPDFMEKPEGILTYKSTKVQGKMYRSIVTHEFVVSKEANFDERLLVPGFEIYLKDARYHKASYDVALFGILRLFGIPTEYEVISGFMDKWVMLLGRKKHSVRERVLDSYMAVRSTFVKQFEEEFYDKTTGLIPKSAHEAIYKKASAWYYTTYHPNEGNQNPTMPTFYSFPWVVDKYLNDILRNRHRLALAEAGAAPLATSMPRQAVVGTDEAILGTSRTDETADAGSSFPRPKIFDINDEDDDMAEFAQDFL
ncbi:RdRP-domain-containing protein [Basidiobolus meristosporus CBS 931.73]|uniref:RNA-dependent RNA polymerase n=1 Tax=Basidiobolus meristosporus CBS 931.73 TaxID=1314790 RepID=A0A1Y1Y435_9FUNG|nr:RdRP-domain-containing protein [Basidiobolus meristosporus CBS 931.73]|eukprot:ORX92476.1 RdRP-domain-containing protein [Basidiobolus meristosporus CBS 931.73]